MMYYKLDPEVVGHIGPDTIMDTSTHPPILHALHYEFDGWPEDDLITAHQCFMVTKNMQDLLESASASGCSFGHVKISTSEEFRELEELHLPRTLPQFSWLRITGIAQRDDFGTTSTGGSLISLAFRL